MRIRVRAELPREDSTVVRGLPVATARKIVADLLHDREDESAIARIVQDALRAELLTSAELEDSVRGHAAAYGAPSPAHTRSSLRVSRGLDWRHRLGGATPQPP